MHGFYLEILQSFGGMTIQVAFSSVTKILLSVHSDTVLASGYQCIQNTCKIQGKWRKRRNGWKREIFCFVFANLRVIRNSVMLRFSFSYLLTTRATTRLNSISLFPKAVGSKLQFRARLEVSDKVNSIVLSLALHSFSVNNCIKGIS